jgi:restriction system protein
MAKYERILTNKATGEQAFIKSNDSFILQQKIEKQIERWQREADKRHAAAVKVSKADDAERQTAEAKALLKAYDNILNATLSKNDRIDWKKLKDRTSFHDHEPDQVPGRAIFYGAVPKKSFFEVFLPFLRTKRERAEQEAEKAFESAKVRHAESEAKALKEYEDAKKVFLRTQKDHNAKIDATQSAFEQADKAAIEYYVNLVLERSEYPDGISLDHILDYDKGTRTLRVETQLPMMDGFTFTTEVKYQASKDAFQTKTLGKLEAKNLYANIIYQIAVRTLHEIFEAEYTGNVHTVEFTGSVVGIDPRKGVDTKTPVLCVKADRDSFSQFNLSRVKPEACAEGLGGRLDKIAFELTSSKKAA